MPQVIHTPQAAQDLIDVLLQIGRHNRAAAIRFSEEVDRKCNLLAQFPDLGAPCEELALDLRQVPVGNYVLFYRPTAYGIDLIRVLHGARDISSLFSS